MFKYEFFVKAKTEWANVSFTLPVLIPHELFLLDSKMKIADLKCTDFRPGIDGKPKETIQYHFNLAESDIGTTAS